MNELIYKTEIDSQIENKLMVAKGDSAGAGVLWGGGEVNYSLGLTYTHYCV